MRNLAVLNASEGRSEGSGRAPRGLRRFREEVYVQSGSGNSSYRAVKAATPGHRGQGYERRRR